MEIKCYLIFLIAIFAEKASAKVNLALNRPLIVGNGQVDEAVDGVDSGQKNLIEVRVKTEKTIVWFKVILDQAVVIKMVTLHAWAYLGPQHEVLMSSAHLLLLEDKDETPDPTKHHSCYRMRFQKMTSIFDVKPFPRHIICTSPQFTKAVGLWADIMCGLDVVEIAVETKGDETNLAFQRPVMIGGGWINSGTDGDENTFFRTKAGLSATWARLDFDEATPIESVHLVAKHKHTTRGGNTVYVLLMEYKNYKPDPTKHHVCYAESVTRKPFLSFPRDLNCSDSVVKKHEAFVLWVPPGVELFVYEVYIIEVEGASMFRVSTSVLLGCQVLVLLIQHIAK